MMLSLSSNPKDSTGETTAAAGTCSTSPDVRGDLYAVETALAHLRAFSWVATIRRTAAENTPQTGGQTLQDAVCSTIHDHTSTNMTDRPDDYEEYLEDRFGLPDDEAGLDNYDTEEGGSDE